MAPITTTRLRFSHLRTKALGSNISRFPSTNRRRAYGPSRTTVELSVPSFRSVFESHLSALVRRPAPPSREANARVTALCREESHLEVTKPAKILVGHKSPTLSLAPGFPGNQGQLYPNLASPELVASARDVAETILRVKRSDSIRGPLFRKRHRELPSGPCHAPRIPAFGPALGVIM
jgi:hypothetical protein